MKRYTCWLEQNSMDDETAMDFDATSPERAAVAYVELVDEESGDGCGGVDFVHVRGPDGVLTKAKVTGVLVPKYTSEVIEPRKEP